MTLDRTGEPVEPPCPHGCRRGWLTGPYSDAPQPCPVHKKHLIDKGLGSANDFAERVPSARAQRAIESEKDE